MAKKKRGGTNLSGGKIRKYVAANPSAKPKAISEGLATAGREGHSHPTSAPFFPTSAASPANGKTPRNAAPGPPGWEEGRHVRPICCRPRKLVRQARPELTLLARRLIRWPKNPVAQANLESPEVKRGSGLRCLLPVLQLGEHVPAPLPSRRLLSTKLARVGDFLRPPAQCRALPAAPGSPPSCKSSRVEFEFFFHTSAYRRGLLAVWNSCACLPVEKTSCAQAIC